MFEQRRIPGILPLRQALRASAKGYGVYPELREWAQKDRMGLVRSLAKARDAVGPH